MSKEKNGAELTLIIAMIAHEFRLPIETISKSAELVNRANATNTLEKDKLFEIMDGVINSCHRMNHLISQIMDIAKAENSSHKIVVQKYSVIAFMESLKEYISLYEEKSNIKFDFIIKVKDPYMICDFRKFDKVLLNLISNAVKYSKSTNRKVTITVSDNPDYLTFSVKDNGIGIDYVYLDKIFEKFYRIENFNTRQTEGCGLGLSIVKAFTELLGGEVTVKSKLGKGSEFIVKIPRTQNNQNPSMVLESPHIYSLYKTVVDEAFSDV
ncbi:MAG: Sensor protein SrrB [Firmicutes bacterium ADurb.Bin193]|nr:MAG: Sensor protein SrrB [Firmicutes bacterium ADurb.Bin193]